MGVSGNSLESYVRLEHFYENVKSVALNELLLKTDRDYAICISSLCSCTSRKIKVLICEESTGRIGD